MLGTDGTYAPGYAPIYTSEQAMWDDLHHRHHLDKGDYAIFDIETWSFTPALDPVSVTPAVERANPSLYIELADKLAHVAGVRLIVTPYAQSASKERAEDAVAAKYGAYAVDIQGQAFTRQPRQYLRYVADSAAIIRRAGSRTLVLAGLATDAGGIPATASEMYWSWRNVRSLVDGFWLNVAVWQAPRGQGCAPVDGCASTGVAFLARITS